MTMPVTPKPKFLDQVKAFLTKSVPVWMPLGAFIILVVVYILV